MSKEVCFKNEIELPPKTEYIFVNCKSKNKSIYKTVQFLVVDKNPKKVPTDGQVEKNYSIFLFAIDSVSKLNFMRTLPNTREYIEKRGWLPLEGYTKVGHNTFPNIMALLTGMKINQLPASCQRSHKKPFDNCSQLMWKNFSQNGYLTSYSEDWPNLGTFNFQQYGFLNTPTDYYARPILLAAIKHLKKNKIGGFQYCVGGQPQMEYLYQFHTEFFQRFHNRLHFTILWANSFSHEDMNMPAVMDDRIRTFFADIEPYLNTTVVVFFSDHGRRFGEIRQTFVGWLEDQMPFIYFHLPPSLQAAHPSWVDNLRANKNKLTSTFDLHLTLQDLLYGHQLYPAAGCPHCASLFSPIPENRSCADAGIPTNYCPCSAEISMESGTNPNIIAAADNAIRKINNILQEDVSLLEIGYKCANLTLSKVTSIRTQMVPNRAKIPESVNIIAFEVKPSMALFEVTVPEGTMEVRGLEEISRINVYGNQSACVKSNLLKPFCFCEKK